MHFVSFVLRVYQKLHLVSTARQDEVTLSFRRVLVSAAEERATVSICTVSGLSLLVLRTRLWGRQQASAVPTRTQYRPLRKCVSLLAAAGKSLVSCLAGAREIGSSGATQRLYHENVPALCDRIAPQTPVVALLFPGVGRRSLFCEM